jgi:hypothetical protein
MPMARWLLVGLALAALTAPARAQTSAPVGDEVDRALLPTGILRDEVALSGRLAYVFNDSAGAEVIHLIGEAAVVTGERGDLTMSAREAVIWVHPREIDGIKYTHLEMLLWLDAQVSETAGTVTSGPALFVTLNTAGPLRFTAQEFAYESSAESLVYREGDRVRQAVAQAQLPGGDAEVAMRVLDATGLGRRDRRLDVRPVMYLRAGGEIKPIQVGGREAYAITGVLAGEADTIEYAGDNHGVYLHRGVPGTDDFFELRADSAVLVLPDSEGAKDEEGAARRATRRAGQRVSTGFGEFDAEAVYLEGDIILTQGTVTVQAERLYLDIEEERALIIDAKISTFLTDRNIPLYLRADTIRQLSTKQFIAENAKLTTDEFHTPHYHIGAGRIELINRTPTEPTGEAGPVRAGTFRIRHSTLNIGGTPVLYWPFVRGTLDTTETSIRSLRIGYSGDFGAELETGWHLFNAMGLETPEGFDGTLRLDYYSERGPAIGADVDYEREEYYGLVRSYLLSEQGDDFLGREREDSSTYSGSRGRYLMRHRQYLEDDWQVSFELSYITDRNFLEEFFESEFDNGKEQETLLYFKRQRDNWAATGLFQWRILDWLTQTESLPDLGLWWMGPSPLGRGALYSENRFGVVRYRPREQTLREFLDDGHVESSGTTARGDTRQEVDYPLDLGPFRVVPFASGRLTAWDQTVSTGSAWRIFGSYGLRGSLYLTKVYPDLESTFWDIQGIRHISKLDFTVWASHTNVDSHVLHPFTEGVETIDEIDGVVVGLRNRFQTKRGPEDDRRTVDVVTTEWEVGLFNDATGERTTNGYASYTRPEDSIARNYMAHSIIWRINDRTALVTESNTDLNDLDTAIFNLSYVVERSPRLSYLIGYRFILETDSHLLAFDLNYRMTEKHSIALRELFDLDRGTTNEFTIGLIRRYPHWYSALSFELDRAEDDFGVSLSIWPEGLPSAALGSRRFTGISEGGGLNAR